MREQGVRTETAEIEVEVAMDRHELVDFDAGGEAAFVQSFRRLETCSVVVADQLVRSDRARFLPDARRSDPRR